MGKIVETSGFVYIWFDKKNKRFYVGSHWGNPNDRYVCSSRWMRNAYKRRPEDFKRRILETVHTTRQDLYEREYAWLNLIKDDELGTRYYNLKKDMHVGIEYTPEVLEKMSLASKGKKQSPETLAKRSASLKLIMSTPEKKVELSLQANKIWETPGHREAMSVGMSEIWKTEEHRENVIPKLVAAQNTPEQKQRKSEEKKLLWQDPEYRQKQIDIRTGVKLRPRTDDENLANSIRGIELWNTEEHQKKMSDAHLNSEIAMVASRNNIKKTHTPEAIAKAKEVRRLNRETAAELRKLNPEAEAEYKKIRSENAKLMAMKRWHPEQFQLLNQ